ncbi:MAG: hypothetical protein ACRDJ5_03935 [Actinomycetota bacterium]
MPDVPDVPGAPEVPDVPDVDPCIADPQSCLPPLPDPDPCVADPQSCLPAPPDPDQCIADPQSCLPVEDLGPPDPDDVVEDVERCFPDPSACLEEAVVTPEPVDDLWHALDEVLAGDDIEASELVKPGRVHADRARGVTVVDGSPETDGIAGTTSGDAGAGDELASFLGSGRDDLSAGGPPNGIGNIFDDIISRYGFPLALIAIAAIFLAIQSRLDRKDPKLALAPVDSTHELLTFK